MDIATRFQPRARAQEYLDRERNGMPEDSGGESESLPRRKFQRTEPVPDDQQFRKPSLPASATRLAPDRRPSLGGNNNARRRSTTMRENMRVPSGPREYPGGSPGKRFGSNTTSGAPSVTETTNIPPASSTRSFLPQINPGPAFGQNLAAGELTRASFGNPTATTDDADSPLTPAERTNGGFDFLPPVNFDDFQSKLASFDEPSAALLSEFPTVGGGRVLRKEEPGGGVAKGGTRPIMGKQQEQANAVQEQRMGRSESFKARMAGGNAAKPMAGESAAAANQGTAPAQSTVSLRTRRQSTVPQSSTGAGQPLPTSTSRPPRKSVGPGLFSSLVDRKPSAQQPASTAAEPTKASLARSSSLNKARRTTLQPNASAGAEVPRVSTLTATTASRQAKVKSLQPPPREPDPNTPAGGRSPGRNNAANNTNTRATTPSSSGNRRQSMAASGRASGLGARTISPTDTRRLKRLSMMQVPPMPSGMPKGPPTPQEEIPAPRFPELPRLTQPSPNPAARKVSTTSLTPTSARASPEPPRFGFNPNVSVPSLSSKSSYQSLQNASSTTSRLPTPKTRNLHSSTAQYGEENETIPPVPMIPKAYESPREHETPFFSSSRKSSATTFNEPTLSSLDSANNLPPPNEAPPRSSFEAPLQTPRKGSHRRNQTIGSPDAVSKTAAKPKQMPDPGGRRNNNLQPLRLPPLNLLPLSSSVARNDPRYPKPSEELEHRDDYGSVQTPEPKRVPKTPSTPMTASKATFYRRQAEENAKQAQVRSTTSHYALRDMMGFDESVTRFFEDSDTDMPSNGIPMPLSKQQQQARSAITPFASGSLPKQSGEFTRLRGRPSGEYQEDSEGSGQGASDNAKYQSSKPQGPRPRTSGTVSSYKTANTSVSGDSPVVEQAPQLPVEQKKEGGGLRRKLSLGWRRTSSKAANHPENKSSPQETPAEKERLIRSIPKPAEMPPPKLPASATWSGELPSLPSSARPSLDSLRRKSHAISAAANGAATNGASSDKEQMPAPAHPKTRSLHSEQPQPVTVRSSSWGNFSLNNRVPAPRSATNGGPRVRQPPSSTSSISAIIKDKDDLAADEEMRRLSQKRRDVDTAARESDALKARAVARSPMTPEKVLHDRTAQLNIFERGEIVDYQKEGVYFTGTKNARKIIGSVTPSPIGGDKDKAGNYGYDDERGDYNIVMGDHLAYRYEVVDLLGKGSFGQVVRCVDHKEGGVVAIKIIRNKKRFHQQALVEVGILGRLRDWDPDEKYATLSITTSFYFRSHLCIVTPCLSINLYELIRAHNFTGFPLPLIRRFSRQLLACLVLLQQKRIIHCDLKPENILLCEARKADVRVIDFGSSCREEEKVYTYIQSRFYRSPEVILGSSYGLGIDMWSFGCILAELWTGYPIFPGENEQEQLACIMEIFGPPDRHLVERCTRKKLFFDSVGKPRVTVSSKGRRRRPSSKTLQQALKTDDEAFVDFIARCLRWDPDRRLKPGEAVNHPFITNQPMSSRGAGAGDEARRATARVRSAAAVPTTSSTTGAGVPSPVKRGNAFAQQQVQSTAPTPRTRTTPATATSTLQASPSKISLLSSTSGTGANRRHSSINSVNGSSTNLPVAGSKRASNGAVLAGAGGGGGFGMPGGMGGKTGEAARPNLAAMAARESMRDVSANAAGGAGGGKAGWRM